MKKQFFVIGTKDGITVSISGPFTSTEAIEVETTKRKNKPYIQWSTIHRSNIK